MAKIKAEIMEIVGEGPIQAGQFEALFGKKFYFI